MDIPTKEQAIQELINWINSLFKKIIVYFLTHKDIKERLNIPRPTLYRMTKDPTRKCKYPYYIEKVSIHKDVITYMNSSSSDSE